MVFPICDSCAASGVLCPDCEERVRNEEITELDVLVSTILKKHGAMGYKSLRVLDSKIVIFSSESDAPRIIGTKGHTALELSKKLGRRVVVIVDGWGKEQIIESLVRPIKVIAINKASNNNGQEVLKLVFDKPLDEGTIELLKELVGEVEIEYKK